MSGRTLFSDVYVPTEVDLAERAAIAIAENDKWLRVSYSSLNTFEFCERKFELAKLYPQRERAFDSFAADVGLCLHAGYQDWLVFKDLDKALWEMALKYPYDLEWQQSNDYRSLESCTATLVAMSESDAFYEYEVAHIVKPDGSVVPAIEVPFEIRFPSIRIADGRGLAFVGSIDAIMQHMLYKSYRTLDIKTHRDTLKDATGKYKYNTQQVPYGLVIEHVTSQEIDDFEVLYLDTYVDVAEPRVTPYEFSKTRDQVQEWVLDTVLKLQRVQRNIEMSHFPRVTSGCIAWNKPCYALEFCESRDPETILAYILQGADPATPRYVEPWIVAELDPFAGE